MPVEEIFNVTLPRPALALTKPVEGQHEFDGKEITHLFGEAIEPGNFAVKKGTSPEVFQAIVTQLLGAMFENGNSADYNERGKIFYTYGDRVSRSLYGPLGFTVMEGTAPVEKYGSKWWLMRASPADTRRFVEANGRRHAWSAEEVERIRELLGRMAMAEAERARADDGPIPMGPKRDGGEDTKVIPIHPR